MPGYCLNTATFHREKLPPEKLVELAADAGYGAVELWAGELREHEAPEDVGRRVRDLGLAVANVISVSPWIFADGARGRLEAVRQDMIAARRAGSTRIAAAPAGVDEPVPLDRVVECYRRLCEIGDEEGVKPMVEIWASAPVLNRLGHAAYVLCECGRADATALLDVYHLHKSGSGFEGLRRIDGASLPVFHVNDVPASIPPRELHVHDRLLPGDGAAPLERVFRNLQSVRFDGWLSLELFPATPWQAPVAEVMRLGLEKMKAIAARATGPE